MAEEAATAAAPVAATKMDPMEALQQVLRSALEVNGLRRGLREVTKALDRGAALLCCLANNCDEDAYTRLVKALCETNNIPLVMVDEKEKLGEWCGLVDHDAEGNPRKVVKCSSAVVVQYGSDEASLAVLKDYIKSN